MQIADANPANLSQGFLFDKKLVWKLVNILSVAGNEANVQSVVDGEVFTVSKKSIEHLWDTDGRAKVPNDLAKLVHLNEASLLESLHIRYSQKQIYTFSGPVLIAVNPFELFKDLYDIEAIQRYSQSEDLPPHIYSIARTAYWRIVRNQKSQTILISGESGAGKTESTKYAMQFLAHIGYSGAGSNSVERRILETNPLLEAFGNARTIRNDNSSRFGKFIELYFQHNGPHSKAVIVGAKIETYLLEKVRVCTQLQNERNFHIFYQLCAAAEYANTHGSGTVYIGVEGSQDPVETQLLDLSMVGSCKLYEYLTNSTCSSLAGRSDLEDFRRTIEAMQTIGISLAERRKIFETLAATLLLGNVTFVEAPRNMEASMVSAESQPWLEKLADMLSIPSQRLHHVLTHQTIRVVNEFIRKPLRVESAYDMRDSLARTLYDALFTYLVTRINNSISQDDTLEDALFCGILDIFGFECFSVNSFEQLCINYANERIQNFFNELIFEFEETLYIQEEISWEPLDFPDNKDCLELLKQRNQGIFAMLDEECQVPQGSDLSYNYKICKTYASHPRFSVVKTNSENFIIKHFAGDVEYSAIGFLEKNKDLLSKDIQETVIGSSDEFVSNLFRYFLKRQNAELSLSSQKARKFSSVSQEFRDQLNGLMELVGETEALFVRCLKPNIYNQPQIFNRPEVNVQLRYGGVLQAIKVSRAGYPVRLSHGEFVFTFRCLLSGSVKDMCVALYKIDPKEAASHCMNYLVKNLPSLEQSLVENSWAIGKTMCFFKALVYSNLMAECDKVCQQAATLIAAGCRGYIVRKHYYSLKNATIYLQNKFRLHRTWNILRQRIQVKKAVMIQSYFRMCQEKSRFLRMKRITIKLQIIRRHTLECREKKRIMLNEAATVLQKNYKMLRAKRSYQKLREVAVYLQSLYRKKQARHIFFKLKADRRNVTLLFEENQRLRKSWDEADKKVKDLETEVASNRQSIKESTRSLKQHEDRLRVLQNFKKRKEEELACKVEELARTHEQLACKEEELARKEEELTRTHEQLACKEEELARKEEELTRTHEQLACKEEELTRTHEQLACKEEELACKEEELTRTHEQLACKEEELARKDGELARWHEHVIQMGKVITCKNEEISKLKDEPVKSSKAQKLDGTHICSLEHSDGGLMNECRKVESEARIYRKLFPTLGWESQLMSGKQKIGDVIGNETRKPSFTFVIKKSSDSSEIYDSFLKTLEALNSPLKDNAYTPLTLPASKHEFFTHSVYHFFLRTSHSRVKECAIYLYVINEDCDKEAMQQIFKENYSLNHWYEISARQPKTDESNGGQSKRPAVESIFYTRYSSNEKSDREIFLSLSSILEDYRKYRKSSKHTTDPTFTPSIIDCEILSSLKLTASLARCAVISIPTNKATMDYLVGVSKYGEIVCEDLQKLFEKFLEKRSVLSEGSDLSLGAHSVTKSFKLPTSPVIGMCYIKWNQKILIVQEDCLTLYSIGGSQHTPQKQQMKIHGFACDHAGTRLILSLDDGNLHSVSLCGQQEPLTLVAKVGIHLRWMKTLSKDWILGASSDGTLYAVNLKTKEILAKAILEKKNKARVLAVDFLSEGGSDSSSMSFTFCTEKQLYSVKCRLDDKGLELQRINLMEKINFSADTQLSHYIPPNKQCTYICCGNKAGKLYWFLWNPEGNLNPPSMLQLHSETADGASADVNQVNTVCGWYYKDALYFLAATGNRHLFLTKLK